MSSMPTDPDPGLPLRGPSRTHRRSVIGHHLILHGYGLWLPNDPRGSGSDELRQEKFEDLGPVHFGRKPVQPPRTELRKFWKEARPRLDSPILCFDDAKRQAIGEAFAQVIENNRYTVWQCAILSNHAHLCIRRHRDDARSMWQRLADASRNRLRLFADVPDDHPVWSNRPYKVFLYTPEDVRQRVQYVAGNPVKEGLSPQEWPFVTPYDGWPYHNKNH